jgi:signal transduction histidine kinase
MLDTDEGRWPLHRSLPETPLRSVLQTDVVAALHDAAAAVRPCTARSVAIAVEAPAPVPPVFADGARLGHMLAWLVARAARQTSDGTITLRAAVDPADHARVAVTISDAGLGMSEAAVEVRACTLGCLALSQRRQCERVGQCTEAVGKPCLQGTGSLGGLPL